MQQRREEIAKCEAIIQERARTLLDALRRAATAGDAGEGAGLGGSPATAQI
jgi:hypothetical protein